MSFFKEIFDSTLEDLGYDPKQTLASVLDDIFGEGYTENLLQSIKDKSDAAILLKMYKQGKVTVNC